MTLKDLEAQLLALTPAEKQRIIQLLTQSLVTAPADAAKPVSSGAGEARIGDTKIAIWELVNAKELGCSDADLLQIYPQLTAHLYIPVFLTKSKTFGVGRPRSLDDEIGRAHV